jgi:hypothetical protein
MGIPLLGSGYGLRSAGLMTCSAKPHYKILKLHSNFILKFLFNAWIKKMAAQVSLVEP